MKKLLLTIMLVTLCISLWACSSSKEGALQFTANGEDFIREGFVTKDGWSLTFDEVNVHLANIRAYQTDPPYDAASATTIDSNESVGLEDAYTIDLAAGDEDAEPILVDAVSAPVGHYNALSWELRQDDHGVSLRIAGQAEKDGDTLSFDIRFDQELRFSAGEYIGDERFGIVTADESAKVEMTFHFDHLFGDAELPQDDELNAGAVGFEPFARTAVQDKIILTPSQMEVSFEQEILEKLQHILLSLGHVGEGHAYSEAL